MENNYHINISPDTAANDLIKIVLALVNTLREVMEKQALRKIEEAQVTNQQIEKMGATFLALEEKLEELKAHFNFSDEDLEIDLKKLIKENSNESEL